jgi:GT2 family glycosyltransferase
MSKMPAITVAIPTYNREEVLVNTIKDVLLAQSYKNFELLVIDQSTKHNTDTEEFIKNIKDKRFRYFRTTPPSVTAARNFALLQARSPYIIFLDDDVVLDKNLVKEFVNTFEDMPHISAIAGRVLQKGFLIKKDVLMFDEYAISHGVFTATKPGYTNAFPGGNCALRVKEVLAIGGFDTRYKNNAFREESDMSLRMANLGYKIYFQPKAVLTHLAAPYGGNRVKTHIYDNPAFYANELMFTLRFARKGEKTKALKMKYEEYCDIPDTDKARKRKIYFYRGLLVAGFRMLNNRQIQSRVVQ